MIFLRPTFFRLATCAPAGCPKWRTLGTLQAELVRTSFRICPSFSVPSTRSYFLSSHGAVFNKACKSNATRLLLQHHATRNQSSSTSNTRVITRYDDLPKDYDDDTGLAYRAVPLSKQEVDKIFGSGVGAGNANRILRVLHGRRVSGTLQDPSFSAQASSFDKKIQRIALAWLRKNVPVDEDYAAGRRAELELAAMEAEILKDSHRLGLYNPLTNEKTSKVRKGSRSVYGESGIDAIRNTYEQKFAKQDQAEKARQAQAEEIRINTGKKLGPAIRSRVDLRRPGENPRLVYYLNRAAEVVPEVLPEMSAWQRLWPSGLVVLGVIGASLAFTQIYVPPTSGARLFPNMPPAAATIISLIVANTAVCLAWHFPPAFRLLNKYFMSVPAYPRALAMIGNVFSHQFITHLGVNMLVLWLVGTRLHDDVGRANFLALYFTSGAVSSFASLASFTLRRVFITSSLGASGAIAGVIASYLWLHRSDDFKIFWMPPDPMKGVPGLGILSVIVLMDIAGLIRGHQKGPRFDHVAHLAGYGTGIVGAILFNRNSLGKQQGKAEKGKSSMTDTTKS